MIAKTPPPPYYAVIFSNVLREIDLAAYHHTAARMVELAEKQSGYLGMDSARAEIGITVSYWESIEAIKAWKEQVDHQLAQKMGREQWYQSYCTRICKVERDYYFP